MMDSPNLIWDTCVFSRYLTGVPSDYVTDIDAYISDAKHSKRTIYFSTIVFAEIRHSAVKQGKEIALDQFFAALNSAFVPIDTNPNIAIFAGRLRASPTKNPPSKPLAKPRMLGTGDAIHLATAIFLKASIGITDIIFHTLDEGKGETWEGKCVPLLGFAEYYPRAERIPSIQAVCDLTISKPRHPRSNPDLGAPNGAPAVPRTSH